MYTKDFDLDDSNVFLNTAYENENYKIMNGIWGGYLSYFLQRQWSVLSK